MSESPTAQHDPFSSSLAGRRLGRYEVLARLASGGMAGVYVARAIGVAGFERLFAIKVLHPHLAHEEEFISMFLDEARLAARIRHPNVVPTIDISDTRDAGYYLVMDYIEGDHLGALLQTAFKQGGRLPAPVSLRIAVDALDGLAAAHSLIDEHGRRLNLVHRDVSPHNIMVSTDGISRITDFGVAKAEVRLSTTRDGQFKGKLAYMAPEHASSGDSDQRSDLFSLAIILWESLTGRRLFRAENHAATLNKICLEPIPAPSEVDPALAPFDPILAKGLARDPAQRFQTAEEFAEAIERDAHLLGGMGHQRAVAKLVRELAADKLASDAELIRTAITMVASVPEPPPAERPGGPRLAPSAMSLPTPVPPAPAQLGGMGVEDPGTSGTPSAPAPGRGRRIMLVLVGTGIAVALGLGLALSLSDEVDDRVTTSPLETITAPSGAAPGEPAAAAVPPEPEPDPAAGGAGGAAEGTGEDGEEAAAAIEEADDEGTAADPGAASGTGESEPAADKPSAAELRAAVAARAERRAAREAAAAEPADPPARQRPKPKPKPTLPDDDLMLNPYRR